MSILLHPVQSQNTASGRLGVGHLYLDTTGAFGRTKNLIGGMLYEIYDHIPAPSKTAKTRINSMTPVQIGLATSCPSTDAIPRP
jgi:hypothetical protein